MPVEGKRASGSFGCVRSGDSVSVDRMSPHTTVLKPLHLLSATLIFHLLTITLYDNLHYTPLILAGFGLSHLSSSFCEIVL